MGKNKLGRFAEMETFRNVFQPALDIHSTEPHHLAGSWNPYFQNNNPITLELGCGKGEYTVGMAQMMPNRNFIGVDIKGARIWRGAKTAHEEQITNVAFLRTRIDFIHRFFGPQEVSAIWLTFSDPQAEKPNKRLTSKLFIDRYKLFLTPDALIHVKTDSDLFYHSTLQQIGEHGYTLLERSENVYTDLVNRVDPSMADILRIQTFYEQHWLKMGKTIKYLCFRV